MGYGVQGGIPYGTTTTTTAVATATSTSGYLHVHERDDKFTEVLTEFRT